MEKRPWLSTKRRAGDGEITQSAILPKAEIAFTRRIRLAPNGIVVRLSEKVENLTPSDRPIGWTQHVTLGPPFLAQGSTQFQITATRSKVIDGDFNDGTGTQKPGAEFDWPFCPAKNGGTIDMRVFPAEAPSGGFSAHLMDPRLEHAYFVAWSPESKVLIGYIWRRDDFPWLARWEENYLRRQAPWNGRAMTCGMEFGVSPLVESRRAMVTRGSLFGAPAYRWLPAKSILDVEYCAFITTADSLPQSVVWDGGESIELR